MSEIEQPAIYQRYLPGYEPHSIQVKKGREDLGHVPLRGQIVSTSDDGTFVIEANGKQVASLESSACQNLRPRQPMCPRRR